MNKIKALFMKPKLEELARREIEDAKYQLYTANRAKDQIENTIQYYERRIQSLGGSTPQGN